MKIRKGDVFVSICLCMALLAGCGSGMSVSQSAAGNVQKISAQENKEEEDSSRSENEEAAGDPDTGTGTEGRAEENDAEEEKETRTGPAGKVVFTVFSSDDAADFAGKEMAADPVYLQTAVSSEVYSCSEPLSGIEVHPILEWAEDYSSFTFSEEILGQVDPMEAEEPFRIYDLYPEGIPNNCLVFYLEDGRCGTFALGYNGSGEEQSFECAIYADYPAMKAHKGAESAADR